MRISLQNVGGWRYERAPIVVPFPFLLSCITADPIPTRLLLHELCIDLVLNQQRQSRNDTVFVDNISDNLNVVLAKSQRIPVAAAANGTEFDLPRFEKHLLCDSDGTFPGDFNSSWEGKVVEAELQRAGAIAWYRNPDRASQDSLGVTYEDGEEMKIVRPDFIFFSEDADGNIVASIVDPHGFHLADALPKLKGLAKYAEANLSTYRRIEAVAKIDDNYRALDLTKAKVRTAIQAATSAKALYTGDKAKDYVL
jgi:hypothetical protein